MCSQMLQDLWVYLSEIIDRVDQRTEHILLETCAEFFDASALIIRSIILRTNFKGRCHYRIHLGNITLAFTNNTSYMTASKYVVLIVLFDDYSPDSIVNSKHPSPRWRLNSWWCPLRGRFFLIIFSSESRAHRKLHIRIIHQYILRFSNIFCSDFCLIEHVTFIPPQHFYFLLGVKRVSVGPIVTYFWSLNMFLIIDTNWNFRSNL